MMKPMLKIPSINMLPVPDKDMQLFQKMEENGTFNQFTQPTLIAQMPPPQPIQSVQVDSSNSPFVLHQNTNKKKR